MEGMVIQAKYFGFRVLIFFSMPLLAQHVPVITNYDAQHYKSHHQNWAITQGSDKMMYFGNTNGLLTFNGNSWENYKLNSKKIVRSVLYHKDRIYTGAYGELGYWISEECKKLTYHNLTGLLPKGLIDNEEIWHITSYGEVVFFQSFSVLLAYDGVRFLKIELPGSVMFLHVAEKKKYIQVLDKGIFYINDDLQPVMLNGSEYFADKIVTAILPGKSAHSLLITTNSDGVFKYENGHLAPWNAENNPYFSEVQINKALKMTNGDIVIGTIRDGLLIFDDDGNIKFRISTTNGLQNNTILALKEDTDQNLWVGLDKGISLIHFNDDILQYRDVKGLIGSVYTATIYDSILYLGTNQGVYFSNLKTRRNQISSPEFRLVKGTQGQTWHLFPVQNGVFCGHNDGSFLIRSDKATKLSNITGGWYNEVIKRGNQNFILQGNYTGLSLFMVDNGNISFSHKIEGYNRPVKKFYIKGDYIWVTGPNNGLAKLTIDPELRKVSFLKKYSFHTDDDHDNIDVSIFRNKLVVSDGEAHYYLDEVKDELLPFSVMEGENNGFNIRPITDTTWLKIYNNHAIRMYHDKELRNFPYAFNQDYHNVANLQNGELLYCMDDGFVLDKVQPSRYDLHKNDTIIHCNIVYNGQTCTATSNTTIKIPNTAKNISFNFFDFDFRASKKYEYKLLPNQNEWKEIENQSSIQFTNLSSGKYILQLKRNDDIEKTVSFEILPPWYLSTMAKLIYLVLVFTLLYLLNKYYERKLTGEKQRFQLENERLVHKHQIQLENQRLHSENQIKNKELANATLQLVQKNEILQDIKDELIEIRKTGDHTLTGKDFQMFMKQINENLTTKSDKKLFDMSFNDVHEVFLSKLKKEYPDLSSDDLKLATYLRMNLASKDIAPLFNISLRGLENKRYRLRKKMHLPTETDVNDFFVNYI